MKKGRHMHLPTTDSWTPSVWARGTERAERAGSVRRAGSRDRTGPHTCQSRGRWGYPTPKLPHLQTECTGGDKETEMSCNWFAQENLTVGERSKLAEHYMLGPFTNGHSLKASTCFKPTTVWNVGEGLKAETTLLQWTPSKKNGGENLRLKFNLLQLHTQGRGSFPALPRLSLAGSRGAQLARRSEVGERTQGSKVRWFCLEKALSGSIQSRPKVLSHELTKVTIANYPIS